MLLYTMGAVRSVQAMGATRLASIEAEDPGIALLRFESGALGLVEATAAARPADLEGRSQDFEARSIARISRISRATHPTMPHTA